MPDRLAELVRQRALVEEHLAWLNRLSAAQQTAVAAEFRRMENELWTLATATNDVLGQLKEGLVGDVSIFIATSDRKDHRAVVRAGVEDVALVVRSGLPMYGDAAIMEGLGADDAGAPR